jgi:hypothetical protein
MGALIECTAVLVAASFAGHAWGWPAFFGVLVGALVIEVVQHFSRRKD